MPLPNDAQLQSVSQTNPAIDATENLVQFAVVGAIGKVMVQLDLQCCPQQPRPAWLAVNGERLDRQLSTDYSISFRSRDGRVANVQDPLQQLVYAFLGNLQANSSERSIALDSIALRIRLYTELLTWL